jgi:Spy/CpxP family protein refolding chaperone
VRTIERLLVIASLSALLPTVMVAQGGRAVIPPRRPARAALKAERQAQRNDSAPPLGERAMLQRQVRQAWIGNVRRQLNLNNEQMRTLNQVNTKYDRQRSDIQRDERQARLGLKAAMEDTAAADQNARIEQQMNALVGAQRRRADLFENEQKELAGFLTPLQRARYSVMQERLQQRLQQLRQSQQDAPAGPPPPENPPQR